MIHLDTSFLIDLLREQKRKALGPATNWLADRPDAGFAVSVFVICELEAGAARAAHPERERTALHGLLDGIDTVLPDHRFAFKYGAILAQMWSSRRSIATMDLLIATAARVDGVPLVTANGKHFAVVPDLAVLMYR